MPSVFPAPQETADPTCDDETCMLRLANGDASALRPIFNRWKLPLMNYLYRSLGSHADAEDLTLAVFEEVWKSASRYQPTGSFGAWLFAIARGRLRHEWRRRSRHPVTPVAPHELVDSTDAIHSTPTDSEVEESLLQALRGLPVKQREALLLSTQTTLSSSEAARALGVRTDYFYVLVNRARTALKLKFFQ